MLQNQKAKTICAYFYTFPRNRGKKIIEMITLPAKGSNRNNEASQEIGKPESQDRQYHKVQETTSDGGEFQLFCDHCRHDVEPN